jgi:hypothetical protein
MRLAYIYDLFGKVIKKIVIPDRMRICAVCLPCEILLDCVFYETGGKLHKRRANFVEYRGCNGVCRRIFRSAFERHESCVSREPSK